MEVAIPVTYRFLLRKPKQGILTAGNLSFQNVIVSKKSVYKDAS